MLLRDNVYENLRSDILTCRLAPGETLDEPGVYELARGQRDHQLVRRGDIEQQLS